MAPSICLDGYVRVFAGELSMLKSFPESAVRMRTGSASQDEQVAGGMNQLRRCGRRNARISRKDDAGSRVFAENSNLVKMGTFVLPCFGVGMEQGAFSNTNDYSKKQT